MSAWGISSWGTTPWGGSGAAGSPLVVRFENRVVGSLRADAMGTLSFQYASEWLKHEGAFPVSLSVPLRTEEYVGGAAHAFFANLLPEGDVRQAVCNRVGVSVDNDYALLGAIGGECAGALSITDPDAALPDADDYRYEEFDLRAMQRIVDERDAVPLLVGGPKTRLSLAGAQDKIPVALLDGKPHLSQAGGPTTHIIKLPHRRFSHLVENEAFVNGLAQQIGLDAVKAELYPTVPPSLIVERYDREPSEEHWPAKRLHQEDFCQVFGLPPARKYEQEGGPPLARIIDMVRAHVARPLVDVRRLFEWQAFNIVAGSSDGHGKNLSLLYTGEGEMRLAPFYDLVSTRYYGKRVHLDLAMGVGGRRNPDQIGASEWQQLADQVGVAWRIVRELIGSVAERCEGTIQSWADEFRSRYGAHPILQTLPSAVAKRARRVRATARR